MGCVPGRHMGSIFLEEKKRRFWRVWAGFGINGRVAVGSFCGNLKGADSGRGWGVLERAVGSFGNTL